MLKRSWRWIKICMSAADRLLKEHYTYKASALAFTTLLALVPLLSVLVSLIALFPFFIRFMNLARTYIMENFIPTSSSTIDFYLQNFIEQASRLPTMGLVFLIITAAALIITVEHTLNEIWHAPKRNKKFFIWVLYWSVLILAPILLGFSLFISSYVFSLSWLASSSWIFLGILPLLINTIMFSALYIIVPNCRVRGRNGLFGGFIAAVLFEIAKHGFVLYIKQFPSYEVIYGTLATVPIFLVWIYISWLIILYGALVSHTKYQWDKTH
jgi:membrane protein